jgi:hypothetical protein
MEDYETKLFRILEWAESNEKFDESTFIGISEYYDEHYEFTDMQELAIDNVYYKWKVDLWHDKKFKNNKKAKKAKNVKN